MHQKTKLALKILLAAPMLTLSSYATEVVLPPLQQDEQGFKILTQRDEEELNLKAILAQREEEGRKNRENFQKEMQKLDIIEAALPAMEKDIMDGGGLNVESNPIYQLAWELYDTYDFKPRTNKAQIIHILYDCYKEKLYMTPNYATFLAKKIADLQGMRTPPPGKVPTISPELYTFSHQKIKYLEEIMLNKHKTIDDQTRTTANKIDVTTEEKRKYLKESFPTLRGKNPDRSWSSRAINDQDIDGIFRNLRVEMPEGVILNAVNLIRNLYEEEGNKSTNEVIQLLKDYLPNISDAQINETSKHIRF